MEKTSKKSKEFQQPQEKEIKEKHNWKLEKTTTTTSKRRNKRKTLGIVICAA